MHEVTRFALLGFGIGAMYSLASQGLIVIYRGSGVLNFAQGAIGMAGAYATWEVYSAGVTFWLAAALGGAFSALIGGLTHLLVMRPLRRASPLARTVATLGVLITIQAAAVLKYGSGVTYVPTQLPDQRWSPFGITITIDRLILFGIAAVMSVA